MGLAKLPPTARVAVRTFLASHPNARSLKRIDGVLLGLDRRLSACFAWAYNHQTHTLTFKVRKRC